MPNLVPMTQGVQATDGNRKVILQGAPTTRFEDGTGGDPEGTAGNITSPQTIDGATPTKINVPAGAIRFFVATNAPGGLRVGNNADLTAGGPAAPTPAAQSGGSAPTQGGNSVGTGYVLVPGPIPGVTVPNVAPPAMMAPGPYFEVGCQAEASGAGPTGSVASTATSTTTNVQNTTANPEIYVMLDSDEQAEIFFYFHMLY